MKIAICISDTGILDKTAEEYLHQYENFLINSGHSVDYFYHRWNPNLNSISHSTFYIDESVTKKEKLIEKLSSILPKKFLTKSITFYGLMRATNLKINYEIKNNISYDICIGICGKINYFNSNVMFKELKNPKVNTMYTFGSKVSKIFPYFSINYKFFYADTLTFNKIAEFFRFLPNAIAYLRRIPEDANDIPLAYYIKTLNISNENNPTPIFGGTT